MAHDFPVSFPATVKTLEVWNTLGNGNWLGGFVWPSLTTKDIFPRV